MTSIKKVIYLEIRSNQGRRTNASTRPNQAQDSVGKSVGQALEVCMFGGVQRAHVESASGNEGYRISQFCITISALLLWDI